MTSAKRAMTATDPLAWRASIHGFIRRFGLLESSQTACGHSMPVSQAHALMELLVRPRITQGELAGQLGLTKSAVSRLVGKLVGAGSIVRIHDERDRRARRLHLTPKGARLAKRVNDSSLARFGELMQRVPREKRAQVLSSLELLLDATPPPAWKGAP